MEPPNKSFMKPLMHESSYPRPMQLLEREPYLTELAGWLEAATDADGCIALVSGEAGIGKTSLLQEFSRRQGSARVLRGAARRLCSPRGRWHRYRTLRGTPRDAWLAALDSGATRERIFAALLDEALESGPASLVVFEDVHWADEATLDLLRFWPADPTDPRPPDADLP